jgi:HlyD family secretion protein
MQRKLKMQKELWDQALIARDDLDTAQASLDAALAVEQAQQAQVESSQAHLKADEDRLQQAQGSLDRAKVNLEHTVITSPISGTIISRSIDKGQTVAASFSSPTLFTIGEDLTKMQVSTNIDEADVGKIATGMEATFSVDAYPGDSFSGKISQVRLASTVVQNVVTYNAMIDVPNPQLKLFPGMTARRSPVNARRCAWHHPWFAPAPPSFSEIRTGLPTCRELTLTSSRSGSGRWKAGPSSRNRT